MRRFITYTIAEIPYLDEAARAPAIGTIAAARPEIHPQCYRNEKHMDVSILSLGQEESGASRGSRFHIAKIVSTSF